MPLLLFPSRAHPKVVHLLGNAAFGSRVFIVLSPSRDVVRTRALFMHSPRFYLRILHAFTNSFLHAFTMLFLRFLHSLHFSTLCALCQIVFFKTLLRFPTFFTQRFLSQTSNFFANRTGILNGVMSVGLEWHRPSDACSTSR